MVHFSTTATTYVDRPIPQISLADFEKRIDRITEEFSYVAEKVGFFAIVDHGISKHEIDAMFDLSEAFFKLPDSVKSTVSMTSQNAGYACKSQVRPSTGAPDEKESYQLQFGENMGDRWITDEHLPGFNRDALAFMHRLQSVSEKLMVFFARCLGFADDFFIKAHDFLRPNCQSVLRLLHYFEIPVAKGGKVFHHTLQLIRLMNFV